MNSAVKQLLKPDSTVESAGRHFEGQSPGDSGLIFCAGSQAFVESSLGDSHVG